MSSPQYSVRSRLQPDGTLLVWLPNLATTPPDPECAFPYQPVPDGPVSTVYGLRDIDQDERNAFTTTHHAYRVSADQIARAKRLS